MASPHYLLRASGRNCALRKGLKLYVEGSLRTRNGQDQSGPDCCIARTTGDPAGFYGLGDRGVLEPGRRADINLIDLDNLALHYPEQVRDLPGGAGRLIQRSDGYVETLVLGQTIVADGELTDSRPGGLVRGPRPMATA